MLSGRRLTLDKVQGLFPTNAVDRAVLVPKEYTIAFVGDVDNFWSEGGADELGTGLLRDGLE